MESVSAQRTSSLRTALPWLGGAAMAVVMASYMATATLGLTSGLATSLYYALQWVSLGVAAAGIVASFGLGTALAGIIVGLVKKWALKKFVAW